MIRPVFASAIAIAAIFAAGPAFAQQASRGSVAANRPLCSSGDRQSRGPLTSTPAPNDCIADSSANAGTSTRYNTGVYSNQSSSLATTTSPTPGLNVNPALDAGSNAAANADLSIGNLQSSGSANVGPGVTLGKATSGNPTGGPNDNSGSTYGKSSSGAPSTQ